MKGSHNCSTYGYLWDFYIFGPATPGTRYGRTGRRYRLLDAQEIRMIRDNKRFTLRGIMKWFKAA
jgi:hypothetical protein